MQYDKIGAIRLALCQFYATLCNANDDYPYKFSRTLCITVNVNASIRSTTVRIILTQKFAVINLESLSTFAQLIKSYFLKPTIVEMMIARHSWVLILKKDQN
jgi:hypothetical protein